MSDGWGSRAYGGRRDDRLDVQRPRSEMDDNIGTLEVRTLLFNAACCVRGP